MNDKSANATIFLDTLSEFKSITSILCSDIMTENLCSVCHKRDLRKSSE